MLDPVKHKHLFDPDPFTPEELEKERFSAEAHFKKCLESHGPLTWQTGEARYIVRLLRSFKQFKEK